MKIIPALMLSGIFGLFLSAQNIKGSDTIVGILIFVTYGLAMVYATHSVADVETK